MKSIPPLVLLCLTTTAALAASFSGTLSDKSGPASISWSGGPMTGALGYGGLVGLSPPCNSTICDIYNLTLHIPSTFYSSNPNFAVHVTVGWSSNIQDIDVYVFDGNGNLVGASATGGTSSEDADLGQLPPGSYQIQIVPASCVATFYGGTISMVQELASPVGKVQYKLGNFTFTSQVLARPPQTINSNPATPLFLEQDAEPRVVHDPLGNIYVAAIQGVPAGTDCASSDSATTWLCNPFASDLPEDDRQWLAFYGQNMVYLTTKQLGTLDNSTLTIY